MKQFDPNKPYQTRSGLKVGELRTYKVWENKGIVERYYGTIENLDGTEELASWSLEGVINYNIEECLGNLTNIPERIEGWTNIISSRMSGLPLMEGSIYTTREDALECRHEDEVYIGDPIHIVHEVYEEKKC